jgi:hypothetical protein
VRRTRGRGRTCGEAPCATRFGAQPGAAALVASAAFKRGGRNRGNEASRAADGASEGTGINLFPAGGACPRRKSAPSTPSCARC